MMSNLIVIPTASCDQNQPTRNQLRSYNLKSQSMTGLQSHQQDPRCLKKSYVDRQQSLPNLSSAYSGNDGVLMETIQDLRLGGATSKHTSDISMNGTMPHVSPFQSLQRGEKLLYRDEEETEKTPVSAINMKTGTNVFTLDVSPEIARRTQNQMKGKRTQQRPNSRGRPASGKGSKGSTSSSRASSRSRSRQGSREEPILTGLSITPLVTPRVSDSRGSETRGSEQRAFEYRVADYRGLETEFSGGSDVSHHTSPAHSPEHNPLDDLPIDSPEVWLLLL